MDHSHMDHSHMDHGGHGGHDMPGMDHGPKCNMNVGFHWPSSMSIETD
jgi:copper transporter 1